MAIGLSRLGWMRLQGSSKKRSRNNIQSLLSLQLPALFYQEPLYLNTMAMSHCSFSKFLQFCSILDLDLDPEQNCSSGNTNTLQFIEQKRLLHNTSKSKYIFSKSKFHLNFGLCGSRVTSLRQFHSTDKSNSSNSHDNNENNIKRSNNDFNVSSLLETWFYEVCPYGSLTANIPFNTVIKPLLPQDYPDMNKVIVQLNYDSPESEPPLSHHLSQITGLYDMNVTFDEDQANMNLHCEIIQGLDLPVLCTFHVPMKFGLTVKLRQDKGIHVEKMESDSIVIETDSGNCDLHSIKCGSISVVSRSGNISSKSTLLGNTILYTGSSGNISMNKLQGSNVSCKTEMGTVSMKSLYTDSTTLKTVMGNINLGQCHGQMHILGESSHVTIDSLEGDLDVALQNGSVNVLLSRHNRADIDLNTGDIGLSFPEGISTDLNLNCPTLNLNKNVRVQFEDSDMPHHKEGFLGQKGISQVNARTVSGTISLQLLDWIQTTRLAFKTED